MNLCINIYIYLITRYLSLIYLSSSFFLLRKFFIKNFILKTIKLIALTGPGDPLSGYWIIKPCSKDRATQHLKNSIFPQFSFPSNCSSGSLTQSQVDLQGVFFPVVKKSFPISKLFHKCKKKSAWVHIPAITFLGETDHRMIIFIIVFLGNQVELLREHSSANMYQVKVRL